MTAPALPPPPPLPGRRPILPDPAEARPQPPPTPAPPPPPPRRTLHEPERELGLLGAVLQAPDAARAGAILDLLTPDAFGEPAHVSAWAALRALHAEAAPLDPTALRARLVELGATDAAGLVLDLLDAACLDVHVESHAAAVERLAALRRARDVAASVALEIEEPGRDAAGLLAAIRSRLDAVALSARGTAPDPPIPLDRPPPPPFPVSALPSWVGVWVDAVAEAIQVPTDLPAWLGLAALGAVAARRAEVEVRPGWREPLNLWTCVVLPSGERKTPVFEAATRPLVAAERYLVEQTRGERAAAMAHRTVSEKRLAAAEAAASKATDERERASALDEAAGLRAELEATPAPVAPRLLADDVTTEQLARLLSEHGRMAVMSDEGGVLAVASGRYHRAGAATLEAWLQAYSGSPIRVDRVGRDPVYVERPAVTVGLSVQPRVLSELARDDLRGKGFLARFLWSLPTSRVGCRNPDPMPVPEPVAETYHAELLAVHDALLPENGVDETRILRLDPDAAAVLNAFAAELEGDLGPGGMLEHAADWGLKLAGNAVRLAGLIHLAEHGPVPSIGTDAIVRAVTLAYHALDHARLAFGEFAGDPARGLAERVLAWARRARPRSLVRRDVVRAMHRRVDEVVPALALLEEHGWLRCPEQGDPRRRPPTAVYRPHPSVLR